MKTVHWFIVGFGIALIIISRLTVSAAKADQSLEEISLITSETPTVEASSTPTVETTPVISDTISLTPTSYPTSTITVTLSAATITLTPTLITDVSISASTAISPTAGIIFLPLISRPLIPTPPPYTPVEKELFCHTFSSPRTIPDDDVNGINDTITIDRPLKVVDVDVLLNISHTWVGDLVIELNQDQTGQSVKLINRPGRSGSGYGCENDDIRAILDDEISSPAENKCASSPAAISGIYIPNQPLSWFDGPVISGNWRLNISDRSSASTGTLNAWCIMASVSENPAPQTPPPPLDPPTSAMIYGVKGKHQALPLDCESRSAVDWAHYFGVTIDELDFYYLLPHSDNPDKGFVGNVNGQWGQIPPDPYGVHAEPVAEVLHDHGLQAYAHRPLSWDALRAEIAASRPVMVWIIDSISNGIPVYYTPSDGLHTIVARYEHTVVVTGYTESDVFYLNGDTIYAKPVGQFLDSWSALGNMAITTQP